MVLTASIQRRLIAPDVVNIFRRPRPVPSATRSLFGAGPMPLHRGGYSALIEKLQLFWREPGDDGEELFPPLTVLACVPIAGLEGDASAPS